MDAAGLFLNPKDKIRLGVGFDGARVVARDPQPGDVVFEFAPLTGHDKLTHMGRGDRSWVSPLLREKVRGVELGTVPPALLSRLEAPVDGERVLSALDSGPLLELATELASRSRLSEVQLGKSSSPEASP